MDEFLTLDEVAKRVRVTVDTVRVWIKEKRLVAYKVGRSYLVKPSDLEKFLEQRRTGDDSFQDRD